MTGPGGDVEPDVTREAPDHPIADRMQMVAKSMGSAAAGGGERPTGTCRADRCADPRLRAGSDRGLTCARGTDSQLAR